jgi:beta-lactamase regulating signal transducer with metallopeptidase domain
MSAAAHFLGETSWLPFLAELGAKATLVLLLTALASALLWRSSAATRHMVWCMGVAGVLALPVISALVPAWRVPVLPAPVSLAAPTAAAPAPAAVVENQPASPALPSVQSPALTGVASRTAAAARWTPAEIAGALALGGIGVGILWLLVGFWGVARIGRSAEVVRDAGWLRTAQDAAERLGLRRPVLLLRSRGTSMPATWGLLWPSVVLPAAAEEWTDDRRQAVLAHELAHVKRFDCLTQALAQVACVLLWWHPAVWYAARRLRVERERACDDLVLSAGARASDYATHLLEIARAHRAQWLAGPALVSMAKPSQLESRLLSVLDGRKARSAPSTWSRVASAAACLLVVAPLAAMRPVAASASPEASPLPRVEAPLASALHSTAAEARTPAGRVAGEPKNDHAAPADRGRNGPVVVRGAAGDTIPGQRSIDDLIAMRAVGVDAAYVAELRQAGYTGLTDRQLIGMRANGVTGRFAAEMASAFGGRIEADELTGMRALGVTADYVADLRRHGVTDLDAGAVKGMRAVGVTGEYVEAMSAAGFGRLPADQLTSLRALHVTPEYVAGLRRAGVDPGSARDVTGMRAVGVTPEYVAEMKALGLDGLDGRTLTSMRAVGVTPEYVREMAAAGFGGLSARDLISLRANNITAAWVREMRANGLSLSTTDQLVRLRVSGVDRELVRSRTREVRTPTP